MNDTFSRLVFRGARPEKQFRNLCFGQCDVQPCGLLPFSPWSCRTESYRAELVCQIQLAEDQLEANAWRFIRMLLDAGHPQVPRFYIPDDAASAVASIGSALGKHFSESSVPTPLPGMHDQAPLDQVHHLQCLRNSPLAGTKASRHSDFVFAWALLGRYVHELA